MKRQIAILGSTGSIGTQALQVIEEHSDLYEVYCLTANNKIELLAEQAHKFHPAAIVVANEQRYDELKAALMRGAGKLTASEDIEDIYGPRGGIEPYNYFSRWS